MALNFAAIAALELIVNSSTSTQTLLAETPSKGLPIENVRTHLEQKYSEYQWIKQEEMTTADVSGGNPRNMQEEDYYRPYIFKLAKENMGTPNAATACGVVALTSIFDYFSYNLGYKSILENVDEYTYNVDLTLEDREQANLVSTIMGSTIIYQISNQFSLVLPEDFVQAFEYLTDIFGLSDLLQVNYSGYWFSDKEKYLEIIKKSVSNGLPVIIFNGTIDGKGGFYSHYSTIYGLEQWLGLPKESDSGLTSTSKSFPICNMNRGHSVSEPNPAYMDEAFLDWNALTGLIYFTFNFNNINDVVAADFSDEFINSAGGGQYFYYPKSTTVTTEDESYSFDTERLRCSYIENEYLVLSSDREDAGEAYLEIDLDDEITMLEFDAGLWGDMEGNLSNLSFSIQVKENGSWVDYITYDLSYFSESRDTLNHYRVLLPDETTKFRFYSTCATPSGDRNKGRIVLDNLTFKGLI